MVADGALDADWPTRTHRGAEQGRPAGRRGPRAGAARRAWRSRRSPARGWPRCRRRSTRASPRAWRLADYDIAPQDGARLAWLYQHGEVVDRHDGDAAVHVTVRLLPADRARFEQPRMTLRARADLADLAAICCATPRAPRSCRGSAVSAPATCAQKTGPLDLVTEADEAAERRIAAGLRTAVSRLRRGRRGSHQRRSVAAATGSPSAELAFVVDPVDGTANFAAGLPLFGVMAAAIVRGEVVGGRHPRSGRRRHRAGAARRRRLDRGAGRPARGPARRARRSPVDAMAGNVSWRYLPRAAAQRGLRQSAAAGRRAGTIAARRTNTAWRAAGHCHFLFFNRLMPWDHAPGWLLHREAGGYLGPVRRQRLQRRSRTDGGLICAPDRASWQALRDALLPDRTIRFAVQPRAQAIAARASASIVSTTGACSASAGPA